MITVSPTTGITASDIREKSTAPIHVVAARPGHADPAITLRVYALVIR